MKKITYNKFKSDEFYFKKVNGTYNKEEKTIEVEDRKFIEFDFKILKDFEPIHLKYIDVGNGELKIVLDCVNDSQYLRKLGNFIIYGFNDGFKEDNKEYFDRYFQTVSFSDEERKLIINEITNRCIHLNKKILDKMREKTNVIENYKETELDINVNVSYGELSSKKKETEKKETKDEVKTKVIKIDYSDYKKTDFKKVYNSFDEENHTVDVIVPEDYDYKIPEFDIKEVSYSDYKKKYKGKYRVADGYNPRLGTIKIYFPKEVE